VKHSPEIGRFSRAVEEFRKIDPEIQAQTILTFVLTMQSSGKLTVKDIATKLGIAQSSASRNVAALSKIHRKGRPGHDLIRAMENPMDRREKFVELTPKGIRVAATIDEILTVDRRPS